VLSATSQHLGPTFSSCVAGQLGVGCGGANLNWTPTPLATCSGAPYAGAVFPYPQNGISCAFNDFYSPGPFPAVNPVPMFALNNNNINIPQPAGCIAQYPAIPPGNGGGSCGGQNPFVPPNAVAGAFCLPNCSLVTGNQVLAGQITTPNLFNTSPAINGVTDAAFNMSNAAKDPHWWVAVGGRLWSSSSIAGTVGADGQGAIGVATKGAGIGYIDALTNTTIEFTPTSSGSNTIALDEQNYVAFLPVNGVQNAQLPAGDFTRNGQNLCGNATTINGLTSGPGCVIVFRQQYLSPLGTSRASGN
jgi:hypothetical protein